MSVNLQVQAVAERLGVSPNLIYAEIRRGKLSALKVGRVLRVSEEQLAEYIKRQETGRAA